MAFFTNSLLPNIRSSENAFYRNIFISSIPPPHYIMQSTGSIKSWMYWHEKSLLLIFHASSFFGTYVPIPHCSCKNVHPSGASILLNLRRYQTLAAGDYSCALDAFCIFTDLGTCKIQVIPYFNVMNSCNVECKIASNSSLRSSLVSVNTNPNTG